MKQATLLDTAVSSDNLGDEIIMDAVRDELFALMPDTYFHTVATHDGLGFTGRRILRRTALGIVGGTNFLSSNLLRRSGWKISAADTLWLHDIVMMGVGWRDYQQKPTTYSAFVYKKALSHQHIHSCRDDYSAGMLRSLGFEVVNTSCPTMWKLSPAVCRSIPVDKAPAVVAALTYYRPEPEHDRALLQLLQSRYRKVFFWTQQAEDRSYFESLGPFQVEHIPANIKAFDRILETEDVDFVGSRLHGGIRALQKGRRTLILSIDNRATEIGRDTGLPVVDRKDVARVSAWIDARAPTAIRLPDAAIAAWKQQFDA